MSEPFQIWHRLQERFTPPNWAIFYEVRNGTGFERRRPRTVDALAMSLWPSRGLELHGIEVKQSRNDWLRELADPAKAEESLYRFCDRWWLAIDDPEIVRKGELPPTWGLLAPKGKKLVAQVEAPQLKPEPLDRLALAAILKAAAHRPPEAVKAEIEEKVKRAIEGQKSAHEIARRSDRGEIEKLQKRIETFERTAGIHINEWDPERSGELFRKFVEVYSREDALEEMLSASTRLANALYRVKQEIEHLKNDGHGQKAAGAVAPSERERI